MEMFLSLIAPLLLLILIVLRLNSKIKLPIGASTVLMMFAGLSFTALSVSIITDVLSKSTIHCGMPQAAAIMLGTFISVVIIPIIGSIGGLIWHFKNRGNKI